MVLATALSGSLGISGAQAPQSPAADAPETEPQDALQAYQRGMEAREAGDLRLYIDMMGRALRYHPAHPILLRHLAQGHARLGELDAALEWLDEVLAVGADVDFDAYEDLAPLREHPTWNEFLKRREQLRQPRGEAVERIVTSERGIIPEGIAYDPHDDVFYLSSVAQRKIVRVFRDGSVRDFIAPGQDGYLSGLGLEVDADRRELWACSAALAPEDLFEEDEQGRAAVHRYDLETGRLIAAFGLAPEGDMSQNLNDLTVHPSGDVYVTSAADGALYVVRHDGEGLEIFLQRGSIPGANGITLTDDGSALYVAKYALGVVRVELETREFADVRHPGTFTMAGVDGLYYDDGSLLAVQNLAELDRVVRFQLGPGGEEAVECQVLIARHPEFVDPTTGVVVGDRFYFIANSQVEPYLSAGDPSSDDFAPVMILGLDL